MTRFESKPQQLRKLDALILALEQLVDHLRGNGYPPDFILAYEANIASARRLLDEGFEQADLDALANAVPSMIHKHPREEPPLERTPEGGWATPRWYDELEGPHDRALGLAAALRFIGEY